jgi:hypothetical protein
MIYRNTDTGELFTESELKNLWEQFGYEMKVDSYEEFLDTLEKVEGPLYKVRSDIDPDRLTSNGYVYGMTWNMEQIEEDAENFGMTPQEFIDEFLEEAN